MSITHERKKLWFDGTDLSTFGVYISGSGVFDSPDPDVEFVQIPGRSGDLIRNRNRFSNFEVTYPASFIREDFDDNFRRLKAFLFSRVGKYCEIEDSYQPNHFRMGAIESGLSVAEICWTGNAGSFDLRFNCKPQLFLKAGKNNFALSGTSGTITNETSFMALPILRITGTGTVTIGDVTVTIASHGFPFIDVDSDLMDCSYYGQNANPYVTLTAESYPFLRPGANNYQINGPSRVIVTPRWWTL